MKLQKNLMICIFLMLSTKNGYVCLKKLIHLLKITISSAILRALLLKKRNNSNHLQPKVWIDRQEISLWINNNRIQKIQFHQMHKKLKNQERNLSLLAQCKSMKELLNLNPPPRLQWETHFWLKMQILVLKNVTHKLRKKRLKKKELEYLFMDSMIP